MKDTSEVSMIDLISNFLGAPHHFDSYEDWSTFLNPSEKLLFENLETT